MHTIEKLRERNFSASYTIGKTILITSKYIDIKISPETSKSAMWPNGKALDYESRDSRFDPWHGQHHSSYLFFFLKRKE